MAKQKTIANYHVKNYVAAVFEERLRSEGFVCPDDKLLCWYRLHGDNIVNSIIFFSSWSNLPVMLDIGYGIHPLFSDPVVSHGVHFTKRPSDDDRFVVQPIVENIPINAMRYSMYSPDIAVDAPGHPGKGIYTLDGIILPNMEKVQTVEDAYLFHKNRRLNHPMADMWKDKDPYGVLSKCFIDMALFQKDKEAYPYCARKAERSARWYRTFIEKRPNDREAAEHLKEWEQLDSVFSSGNFDEYLSFLRQKEQTNAAWMRKHLGLK